MGSSKSSSQALNDKFCASGKIIPLFRSPGLESGWITEGAAALQPTESERIGLHA